TGRPLPRGGFPLHFVGAMLPYSVEITRGDGSMKSQNLTQGGILKSLVTFAFPVLLALFLQIMYGAADLIIVGQFAGTGEQSGVASGSQLFHLVTLVITGLTMGVTVL